MTNERRVIVHPNREALAASVAARFITKMLDLLEHLAVVHVALTGGTMGADVLEAIGASPAHTTIDWSRVHIWWGDERWLPTGDPERNDRQARDALLRFPALASAHTHPFPADDGTLTLPEAAVAYADALAKYGTGDRPFPVFEILFLGVGADGHIASLFPYQSGIRVMDVPVIPVTGAPKPPLDRLSLTRAVLNSSERIWLVLAGSDKASALGLALAGASRDEVPVAGIKGRRRTVFFVDKDAAAEVPESLRLQDYSV